MSKQYDEYIVDHKYNVLRGFDWLNTRLHQITTDDIWSKTEYLCASAHDYSKYEPEEYEAYDKYFYGNRSYEVVQKFNLAWLNHIHKNPHHWQHWVLISDDPIEGIKCLDMPIEYIIEMICDWWSFSWKNGNLKEIFKWYSEHKDHMKLSDNTRIKVEMILALIEQKLDSTNE